MAKQNVMSTDTCDSRVLLVAAGRRCPSSSRPQPCPPELLSHHPLPSSSTLASHLLSSLDIDRHAIVRAAGELNLAICFLLFKHYDL